MRDQSANPDVYSPGGLCRIIEQNAARGRRKHPNPAAVAELIQLARTKTGWDAIEYVDADDQIRMSRRTFAPGVRLILKGKEKGPFSIGYALYEQVKGGRWKWVHSIRYLKGKFNLEKETLSVPNHLDPVEKSLSQMADLLLSWVVQERAKHGP